jgi:hypothetical protein
MDVEILRPGRYVSKDLAQNIMRNACIVAPNGGRSDLADLVFELFKLIKFFMDNLLVVLFIFACKAIFKLFEVVFSDDSFGQKFLRVKFISSRMSPDLLIHKRLGEVGLILLIVSISPIAHNINENVFLELLSVGYCYLHALIKDIRLVSIYMYHGCIYCFGDFCAVERRS